MQSLFNVDKDGNPIVDKDGQKLFDITEEVIQLLKKYNLTAQDSLQIIHECERIIYQKCLEMPF